MNAVVQYANCWEDADVLLDAMGEGKGHSFISIASAGDNSLSLLTLDPDSIAAVDSDPAQVACGELKKALFEHCDHGEVLAFLGVRPASNRIRAYRSIRLALPPRARRYWDLHVDAIDRGLIHAGRLERYFTTFRRYVLPLVARRSDLEALLEQRSLEHRREFFERHLSSSWKEALLRPFFSRALMARLGRSRDKFIFAQINIAEHVLGRIRHGLVGIPTHDNPYLQYILFGNYVSALPHYLRERNFATIKSNIRRLRFVRGGVESVLGSNGSIKYDGFNLSDIFEYVDVGTFRRTLAHVADSAHRGARILYWNMLVPRRREDDPRFTPLRGLAAALYERSKTFFYRDLIVEEYAGIGS